MPHSDSAPTADAENSASPPAFRLSEIIYVGCAYVIAIVLGSTTIAAGREWPPK